MELTLPPLLSLLPWCAAAVTLALLTMLLLAPLTLRGDGRLDDERLWGELRASWAFGLLAATLSPEHRAVSLCGLTLPLKRGKKAHTDKPKRRRRSRERTAKPKRHRGGRARLERLLGQREALLMVLKRLSTTVHWQLSIEGRAGLEDPGSTALSHAALEGVAAALPGNVNLAVYPNYLEEQLELRARLVVELWLGELLLTAMGLLTRREVWRAIAAVRP